MGRLKQQPWVNIHKVLVGCYYYDFMWHFSKAKDQRASKQNKGPTRLESVPLNSF